MKKDLPFKPKEEVKKSSKGIVPVKSLTQVENKKQNQTKSPLP
jgi:hypothetical protein